MGVAEGSRPDAVFVPLLGVWLVPLWPFPQPVNPKERTMAKAQRKNVSTRFIRRSRFLYSENSTFRHADHVEIMWRPTSFGRPSWSVRRPSTRVSWQRNRLALELVEPNSRKPEDAAACASRRAIGDNGSTLDAKDENSGPFLNNLNVFLATYSGFCSLYIGAIEKPSFLDEFDLALLFGTAFAYFVRPRTGKRAKSDRNEPRAPGDVRI